MSATNLSWSFLFYKLLKLQNKILKYEIMEKVKKKTKKWHIFFKFDGILSLTLKNLRVFKYVF